jgi:hypothetical protein
MEPFNLVTFGEDDRANLSIKATRPSADCRNRLDVKREIQMAATARDVARPVRLFDRGGSRVCDVAVDEYPGMRQYLVGRSQA